MRLGGQAESTRAEVVREQAGPFNIDELDFDFDLGHDATEPMGKVCICDIHTGGVVRQCADGEEGTFAAGDLFM